MEMSPKTKRLLLIVLAILVIGNIFRIVYNMYSANEKYEKAVMEIKSR